MTRIIVYHDTETLASRARRPVEGETIGYRAIADWNEELNATFDEVLNLSSVPQKKTVNKNVKV